MGCVSGTAAVAEPLFVASPKPRQRVSVTLSDCSPLKRRRPYSRPEAYLPDGALDVTPLSRKVCQTPHSSPAERSLDGNSAWLPIWGSGSRYWDFETATSDGPRTSPSFFVLGDSEQAVVSVEPSHELSPQQQPGQKLEENLKRKPLSVANLNAEAQRFTKHAWEISGLLRPKLASEVDFEQVQRQIGSHLNFLVHELPRSADKLAVHPRGLMFQALLARAGCGRGASHHDAAQDQMDAVLGKERVDLLAEFACTLCGLLRVKIEDDGDLLLARRVLEDCQRFFRLISTAAEGLGATSWQLLHAALQD